MYEDLLIIKKCGLYFSPKSNHVIWIKKRINLFSFDKKFNRVGNQLFDLEVSNGDGKKVFIKKSDLKQMVYIGKVK